ncbi:MULTISPECIES: TetR/AcrR family transcriptional regulator C-terminal domain-containing protein [unclassified Paenibacillus]|uniref:TetR/AcrR family transcriptional regulator C-terminal domain-containing protein n=1 Tax=unclassified Paenibacillus TaxID=185978 RepID=UPI0027359100|nr:MULTISPECIES: TetR/AcrR family transcriptional regulator C-terminal domain-containing protein [unclassified Paenibacillus]
MAKWGSVQISRTSLGDLIARFHAGVRETESADEAIRRICALHYSELGGKVALAPVTQIELRQSSLELRKAIGEVVKPYIRLIEEVRRQGVAEGTFRANPDVKLTRLLLFGGMDEAVTSWLIAGRKYSLAAQVDKTVEFFLQGLRS